MKNLNLIIVEDDKSNAATLINFIRSEAKIKELTLQAISETNHVLDAIKQSPAKPYFVIISEPAIGRIKFGSEVLSRISQIKKFSPASEVIVLLSPNNSKTVIETFHSGVYDVVLKDEYALTNVVNSIHRFLNIVEEPAVVKKQKELATFIQYY